MSIVDASVHTDKKAQSNEEEEKQTHTHTHIKPIYEKLEEVDKN